MFFPGGRSDSAVAVRVSGMMIWRENENHIARDYYTASVYATAACGAQEDTKLLFCFFLCLLTQGEYHTFLFPCTFWLVGLFKAASLVEHFKRATLLRPDQWNQ